MESPQHYVLRLKKKERTAIVEISMWQCETFLVSILFRCHSPSEDDWKVGRSFERHWREGDKKAGKDREGRKEQRSEGSFRDEMARGRNIACSAARRKSWLRRHTSNGESVFPRPQIPPDAFQGDFVADETSGEIRENFHAVIKNAFSRVVRQPRQIFHLFREPTVSARQTFTTERRRAKINASF